MAVWMMETTHRLKRWNGENSFFKKKCGGSLDTCHCKMWHHSAHQCGFFLGGGGWPYLITELICKFRANFPWVGSPEIVFYKKFGKQIHEAKNVHDFNLRFQIHIWFPYIYIYIHICVYIYIYSWWFQPLWKICSSNWKSSPNSRGENKKKWTTTQIWMVKIMENPIRMDDLGENPLFSETSIYIYIHTWFPYYFHLSICSETSPFVISPKALKKTRASTASHCRPYPRRETWPFLRSFGVGIYHRFCGVHIPGVPDFRYSVFEIW